MFTFDGYLKTYIKKRHKETKDITPTNINGPVTYKLISSAFSSKVELLEDLTFSKFNSSVESKEKERKKKYSF